jgi:hypothetical protein
MSGNREKPHMVILPEDRANEQIANGFKLSLNINYRAIRVEKPAGGWLTVVQKFKTELVPEMQKYPACVTVMLIDFDCKAGGFYQHRLNQVTKEIPEGLKNRVFVLGVLTEPEDIKDARNRERKTFEKIGETLAEGCPDSKNSLWKDVLMKHNEDQLQHILKSVRPFLFTV